MIPQPLVRVLLRGGPRVAAVAVAAVAVVGVGDVRKRNTFSTCAAAEPSKSSSSDTDDIYDIGIIGGGIVGLAVAREFKLRYPEKSMVLLEKEETLATAQTGHNSGVIHAGMYYKPGSMKAKLCVQGAKLTYEYCQEKGIPFEKVGKLIVAVHDDEIENLKVIYERALENKVVDVEWLDNPKAIRKVEPYCTGLQAVHCRSTGIVDWQLVAQHYAKDFTMAKGDIRLQHAVVDIMVTDSSCEEGLPIREDDATDTDSMSSVSESSLITVVTEGNPHVKMRHLVTCAGMYSDRLSTMTGGSQLPKMIPFRGEYLLLKKEKSNLVKGNIYPVPDPKFPFLGVHFTPRINGDVWLGPNAVLGFAREGYSFSDINWSDLYEILTYEGTIQIARKHGLFGLTEIYKSVVLSAQVKELQKYVPDLKVEDVSRGPSGVRAQAVDRDGTLVEDFIFDDSQRKILHVRNAPSPGATSSLAIGKMIVDKAEALFDISSKK